MTASGSSRERKVTTFGYGRGTVGTGLPSSSPSRRHCASFRLISCSTARLSLTAQRACPTFMAACLYAFDLLHLRVTDLRPVELVGRRAMLKKLIRRAAPVLIFSEHMDAADGERMFRHACALGLEGIVSKRR